MFSRKKLLVPDYNTLVLASVEIRNQLNFYSDKLASLTHLLYTAG